MRSINFLLTYLHPLVNIVTFNTTLAIIPASATYWHLVTPCKPAKNFRTITKTLRIRNAIRQTNVSVVSTSHAVCPLNPSPTFLRYHLTNAHTDSGDDSITW